MRRTITYGVLVTAILLSMSTYAPGSDLRRDADPVKLFSFDTNPDCRSADCLVPGDGAFYPGGATRNGSQFDGQALQVPVGADVEFTNISSEHHNIVSFAKRRGKPIFGSDEHVIQGATSTITTRYLRPGVYPYFCGHHPTTMFGLIEVVR